MKWSGGGCVSGCISLFIKRLESLSGCWVGVGVGALCLDLWLDF